MFISFYSTIHNHLCCLEELHYLNMPIQESFSYLKIPFLIPVRTKAHHHCSTSPHLHTREHSSAPFGLESHFKNKKEGFTKCTRGINKPASIPANQNVQGITALSRIAHCPIYFCAIRVGD